MRMPHSRRSFLGAMSAAASAVGLGAGTLRRAGDEPLAILGGKPVRPRAVQRLADHRRERREGLDGGPPQEEVVPDRRRLRQPVRGGLGPDAGRQALRGRRQRHQRPDHVAGRAGDRAGRRGDRAAVHVRRHDQRRADAPRAAGLRRHRPRDLPDRRPQDRGGDHRADARASCRCTSAARPPTWTRSWRSPPGTSCRSSKTPARPHLAEWRGKKVSTLGDLGCFSFQASKNLNSGEGGAILTSSDDLALSNARASRTTAAATVARLLSYVRNGANLRMTEFQAALLLQQLTRLEEQSRRREQNAAYLTELLREIPGIAPARMYDGCTRNAYHLYMFRYDPAASTACPGRSSSRRCTPRASRARAAISRSTGSRS